MATTQTPDPSATPATSATMPPTNSPTLNAAPAPTAPPAAPAPVSAADWPLRVVVGLLCLGAMAGLALGTVYLSHRSPRWNDALGAGWTAIGVMVAAVGVGLTVPAAVKRTRR
ncbi:hypothetical protein [Streptomyces sp. NPDC056323]|uniref:hypothetical protein n=1 Tax=unclassified Streptomyces TaxID=2593676 RepID=UPI0035DABFA0